ncbi:flavin-containing monooxygenase [Microbacterium sp. A93]|uniref:flavin-containing monooxygenase n=1 Tax=Microbacterium sp. A93 TaxID=3450716 RepID=UPI003F421194
MTSSMPSSVRVAIIGAGFAGLGAALRLEAAGESSFLVLEQSPTVGGTWHDNRYPGVACDIPSHLYCYSFRPHPWFTRRFAPGAEIQTYLEESAAPVADRIRLSVRMLAAAWDETARHWIITTTAGTVHAQALVMACGRLNEPRLPDVTGTFAGPVIHSARWDPEVPLDGARVALVGTGASAVQLLPHIARRAREVVVLQRSATYILPRDDHEYTTTEQRSLATEPGRLRALRDGLFAEAEQGHEARLREGPARQRLTRRALGHLADQVQDAGLREALTPGDEFGCKRALFSDEYYPALGRPHVTLVPSALSAFEGSTVVAEDGSRHEVDVVVAATGFESVHQPYACLITGRGGRRLAEHWRHGMRAFASTSVSGFPNMFVLNGPHATLGHNSSLLMIEAQVEYLLGALATLSPGTALDVTPESEAAYIQEIDHRSATTVWLSGCTSWYIDPDAHRQVLLWPGTAQEFADRLSRFDPEHYVVSPPVGATLAYSGGGDA